MNVACDFTSQVYDTTRRSSTGTAPSSGALLSRSAITVVYELVSAATDIFHDSPVFSVTKKALGTDSLSAFYSTGGKLMRPELAKYIWAPVSAWNSALIQKEHPRTMVIQRSADELAFKAAFARAEVEDFEDGRDSNFSEELSALVTTYGSPSENIIRRLLLHATPDVAAEAMHWLSHDESPFPLAVKTSLLHVGLTSHSVLVRDAAALAFGSLKSEIGIRLLTSAIAQELNLELRSDMQQILFELKGTWNAQIALFSEEAQVE
jgi:hypothetical protein